MNKQNIKTIQNSIAHLNGYALIIKARTGYNPIAVDECIKELNNIIKMEKVKNGR
jgi:hypothetical protein